MQIWDEHDTDSFFRDFSVECLYYEARLSSQMRQGLTALGADAIFGYKYADPVKVNLLRTSVNWEIVYTPDGRIYEGGARFSIPPYELVNNQKKKLEIFDRIFMGDIVVVLSKPIRDFDLPRKGYRDTLFAFDVKKIIGITSVSVEGKEIRYEYGKDYNLMVNGALAFASVRDTDGSVVVIPRKEMPIVSELKVNWLTGDDAKNPAEGSEYTVEFLSSPNYVVWDNLANVRATEDGDLPKSVLCVRRAFFNQIKNPVDEVVTRQPILQHEDQIITGDD
jgi:hypothetical protein